MKHIAILFLAIAASAAWVVESQAADVPKPPAVLTEAEIHQQDVARLKFREAQLELQSLYAQIADLQSKQAAAVANAQASMAALKIALKCGPSELLDMKALVCAPGMPATKEEAKK